MIVYLSMGEEHVITKDYFDSTDRPGVDSGFWAECECVSRGSMVRPHVPATNKKKKKRKENDKLL